MAPPSHVMCRFYLQGICKFGDECKFLHPSTDHESQTPSQKRTSSFAGFSDPPARRRPDPPAVVVRDVYAVICESSIETFESSSQVVSLARRTTINRITDKIVGKTTRDIQGIYTTMRGANAKATDLQEEESEERQKHVKADVAEDGRISWKLDLDIKGTEKIEVKVEKWMLDQGVDEDEDDHEIVILLGNSNVVHE